MTHALALAHAVKQQPFNADFYSVAATVIPVLFLAHAVQGTVYENVLTAVSRATLIYMTGLADMAAARRVSHDAEPPEAQEIGPQGKLRRAIRVVSREAVAHVGQAFFAYMAGFSSCPPQRSS